MSIRLHRITACCGGTQVIRELTLTLPCQGVVSLFAPSGSGKTTLLRLLAGLALPQSGRMTGLEEYRVSAVFQEHRLLPQLTAQENLQLVLPRDTAGTLALRYLREVGLEEAAGKRPGELSGGMCRRVALARAFAYGQAQADAGRRVLYLLDEPFQGLDDGLRRQMGELVLRHTVPREAGTAPLLVLVTHDWQEAQALSRWIVCFTPTGMEVQSVWERQPAPGPGDPQQEGWCEHAQQDSHLR